MAHIGAPGPDEQQDLIGQFQAITDTEPERARHFLEASAWDIGVGISAFYENQEDDIQVLESIADQGTSGPDVEFVEEKRNQEDGEEPILVDDATPESSDTRSATGETRRKKIKGANMSGKKFATLGDFNKNEAESGGSSGEEEEPRGDRQSFYVGGSEHGGGQEVLGPRGGGKPEDMVNRVMRGAQEKGAEPVDPREEEMREEVGVGRSGGGYRLGDNVRATEYLGGAAGGASAPTRGRQMASAHVTFWQNGFSIDDGPLRSYQDPQSMQFMQSIGTGRIPDELVKRYPGKEVDLKIQKRMAEEYKPPPLKAFSGKGQMLGAVIPSVSTNEPEIVAEAKVPAPSEDNSMTEPEPEVKINEDEPTTKVQIRLADGKRLVVRLNHTHRVSEIRNFICCARPDYALVEFALQTTFPNKVIEDEEQTLADAKLLNAVVVQKLIKN